MKNKVILASASPRRIDFFRRLGINFESMPHNIEEKPRDISPEEYVMYYAKEKAISVKNRIKDDILVIGFDTIVFFQNKIIGKPQNKKDALGILLRLNNNIHSVFTGIACLKEDFMMVDYESAKVRFRNISEEKWWAYIENNSVLDKAGAYGIQSLPEGYADVIEGRIETVIGIPVEKLRKCLERMGIWNLRQ